MNLLSLSFISSRRYLAKYLSRYYLKGNYDIVMTFNRPGGVVAKYMLRLYKRSYARSGARINKTHREIELPESFYRELSEFLPIEVNISRCVPVKMFVNALVTRQEIIDELLLTL